MDIRITVFSVMCTVVRNAAGKDVPEVSPAFLPAAIRARLVEPLPQLASVRAVPATFTPAQGGNAAIRFAMPEDGRARALEVIDPDEGFFLRTPVMVWPVRSLTRLNATFIYTDVPLSVLRAAIPVPARLNASELPPYISSVSLKNPRFSILPRAIGVEVDVSVKPRFIAPLNFTASVQVGFRPVVNRSGPPGLIGARIHRVILSGGGTGTIDRLTRGWLGDKVGAQIAAAATPELQKTLAARLTPRNDPARHPIGFSRAQIAPVVGNAEPALRLILSSLSGPGLAVPDWTALQK